jgi:formate hydrogenlyase subunit 3/multisubunit Na+/H+ antiporter MnhD subunit
MTLILAALLILLGGAVLALLAGRGAAVSSFFGALTAGIAGLLAAGAALRTLAGGGDVSWQAPWAVPVGAFAFHLDALAACFVLPVAVLGFCCALYGGSYLKQEGAERSLAPHWFFFNLMLAAMLAVVTAANAVLFLAAWEIMTVSSFFLVAWDHRQEQVRKAAWLYLLAAHCGLMLLLAFFARAGTLCGSYDFGAFGPLAQLPAGTASILFLLVLLGFGVKAGLFPLHVWLPDAHPAAPSHVSALMSGVLVKTGIYGILRALTLLPPAPAWWGWLVALLGAGGALYGIAMASLQRDIKRCLAYSTVENVGIIFLGLGFGMVAAAQGHATISLLALAGALLHVWNHALFKGLMFLGAGALVHSAGTRDMNLMGGLLRRMPLAGLLWIGGSLAISALPPFNGLVSEWLIYLGLLRSGISGSGLAALGPLLLFGLLGIVGALALLTFSRLVGICLLGEPRQAGAAGAHEAPTLMLLPMLALLAGCLLIGLLPGWALRLLERPLALLLRAPPAEGLPASVPTFGWCGVLLLAAIGTAALLLRRLQRRRAMTASATWGCGFRFASPRMSYTGEAYSELACRRILPKLLRPDVEGGIVTGPFPAPARLHEASTDPVLQRLLLPLFSRSAERCQRLRWLQQGQLPMYLLYIFVASAALMAWSLWAGRGG